MKSKETIVGTLIAGIILILFLITFYHYNKEPKEPEPTIEEKILKELKGIRKAEEREGR